MPARKRLGLGGWLGLLVGLAALAIALFAALAEFYTDLLWFRDLGHENVVWVQLGSRFATGLVWGALVFALLFVNARLARRMAPRGVILPAGGLPEQVQVFLNQLRATLGPVLDMVILLASAGFAFVLGSGMASRWHLFQKALKAVPFGEADPQFGLDIGFFMFRLPALRAVADGLLGALVLTFVVTALVHLVDGAIRPWDRWRGFDPHVKAHLSVLGALIIAAKAFDYLLDIYELDFSPRGQVVGASYTDVYAQLPALYALIGVALVSAVVLLVNIRFKGWRLPIAAVSLWLAASILAGVVYPTIIQQLRVAPNEIAAEAPFIERNIAATRKAFDLDRVTVKPFAAEEDITAKEIAANRGTIGNVRLWDPNVAGQAYKQLQEIRLYYDFNDVDIDRYQVPAAGGGPGETREFLVSAREMNVGQLSETARTFVNQHLYYTHGYGVVMSPVNETNANGAPVFAVRDLPPTSTIPGVTVTRPGIYFGEESSNYVVAGTDIKEFDYPRGEGNATTSYEGKTGVAVGGFFRRLAFAVRFGTTRLLFSGYIRPDSKVLYHRTITERAHLLAPFLDLDGDPYMAVVGGRLVWILDGYTRSDHYPYSERYGGINYMRNSVKVTIDAYDGTTTLYAFGEKDPVLETWRRIFPGLVVDDGRMPKEVRAHLRYPEDIFSVQAEVYKTYHMTDPGQFYNKEDQWELPGEASGEPMMPFYVLMRLPGEESEQFIIMMPFTPRGKANMAGWMAAKSDPGVYGERIVYTLPKQRLVLGPEQVDARVNQDPTISQQLSLWNQRGSQVIFGNLLVIPIEDSIVYIRPLYLQAERNAIPQLTRVIVVSPQKVAMEQDLTTALAKVFGEAPPAEAGPGAPSAPGTAAPEPGAPATGDAAQANDLYRRALEAQRRGDWAEYGRLISELGRVLGRLSGQGSSPATPTP